MLSTRQQRQAGMTLLEIMIAMAIMLGMLGMAWSTFSSGLRIKRTSESINDRFHEIRVAMWRMNTDLSAAYISANEDQDLQERRTLFLGKDGSDVDELRFSSLAHRALWADANESEQTMIYYYEESDKKEAGVTNLVRRENRRMTNQQWDAEPAEIEVLLRDVEKVQFEYYDWKEKDWSETWDSTKLDAERGRLPTRVRITIELKNGNGDPVKFVSQARISLQEELKFFTN